MSLLVNDCYSDVASASLMAFDQYLHQEFVHLSNEEANKLVTRLMRARREPKNAHLQMLARYAREQLVESCQPMVLSLAKGFVGWSSAMEFLDLVQEGNIGLLKMLEHGGNFDHAGGFFALARKYITGYILKALRDRDGVVRLPSHVREQLKQFRRVIEELSHRFGRRPEQEEIAQEMGVTIAKVCELREVSKQEQMQSLQSLQEQDDRGEDYMQFVSLYQEAEPVDRERQMRLEEVVQEAVESLPTRQAQVMRLRYGLDGGHCHTPMEIEQELGVQISGSETRARRALHRKLAGLYASSDVA